MHLAWYAAPCAYLHAAPENLACLGATADLVGRLAAAGCRRFVGAGTCLELDADAGYLAPGSPPGPRSVYAAAKHAAHVLTIVADFWPEDESIDEFIATVREWRRGTGT